MRTSVQEQCVDRIAKRISDPVLRLKFLKAIAPAPWVNERRWRRVGLLTLIAAAIALVVLVPATLLPRLRASVRTRNAPAARTVADAGNSGPAKDADVWLVESAGESETYSNGLRIDNRFRVASRPRSYLAFPAQGTQPVHRSEPAGIVFHTTESKQAPFEASENRLLRRLGESLLEYVKRRQSYNFVIDRFGRVYRVVPEDQTAHHAGYSTWADENWRYVNLNESFIGISFETVSPLAQKDADLSPAQARSAATLVEMLRRRFHLPASNCVVHAQVSVNPGNMYIGLHLDWASGFPFEAMSLPDNYAQPLPSLWAYGFDYDSNFAGRAGNRMQTGLAAAEEILAEKATAAGLQPAAYKKMLRQRYRQMLARVRGGHPESGEPE
jgi:hypothetical protein